MTGLKIQIINIIHMHILESKITTYRNVFIKSANALVSSYMI